MLDTWFSSALWPFSTMGWPDEGQADYQRYFPTDTLVTGYDIIFFWVSRMIFQSLEFTHKRPFKNVLIHGLIRDAQGRKMSKSLGNGVDPMDVVDEYGADALRWFLATGSTPGQDVRYSTEKMAAAWNFINKIWNASRYVLMNVDDLKLDQIEIGQDLTLADRWILSKLQTTIEEVTRLFEKFEFGEAGRILYHFIWNDYCDWYIEMTKEQLQADHLNSRTTQSVLIYVLDQFLRLLHPIMPFVTEEIWQHIAPSGANLCHAKYPEVKAEYQNDHSEKAMDQLIQVITAVRQIRNEMNTPLSKPLDIMIQTKEAQVITDLQDNQAYIDRFCHCQSLKIGDEFAVDEEMVTQTLPFAQVLIPLAGLIKIEDEIQRLQSEVSRLQSEVTRASKKLDNESFVAKAPEAVVEQERQKLTQYEEQLQAVKARIETLQSMN